jgi:glycine/D-amino acid oxidase-like deaminating enzyme
VHGLLQAALRAGVELYTRTPVCRVTAEPTEALRVETNRGTIMARCIVVATNAFTSKLLPELAAIKPRQSQIQLTNHAHDRARGRVVTCDDGPTFFNQPRSGARDGRRGGPPHGIAVVPAAIGQGA